MLAHFKTKDSVQSLVSTRLKQGGFSLVELLMTLAIMVTVLSVVLSSQSNYTSTAILNNAADEIALLLRQAQVYGVGVKEFTPGSTEFDLSYGVSFNTTDTGSDDAYIFFADRTTETVPHNQRYTYGDDNWDCPPESDSECIYKTILPSGIVVSDICFTRTNNNQTCIQNPGGARGVDITFTRPNTDATMRFFSSSGTNMTINNLQSAIITLRSPEEVTRDIIVYTNGQISIE